MNRFSSILLLSLLVSFSVLVATSCKTSGSSNKLKESNSEGQKYLGHTWYKIMFVEPMGPSFDVNRDVLAPTKRETAQQKIFNSFQASLTASLLPIMSRLMGAGNIEDGGMFEALSQMAERAGSSMLNLPRRLLRIQS